MGVLIATDLTDASALLAGALSPVVVIPVYNSYEDVVRCLESIVTHTPSSAAMLDRRRRRFRSPDGAVLETHGEQIPPHRGGSRATSRTRDTSGRATTPSGDGRPRRGARSTATWWSGRSGSTPAHRRRPERGHGGDGDDADQPRHDRVGAVAQPPDAPPARRLTPEQAARGSRPRSRRLRPDDPDRHRPLLLHPPSARSTSSAPSTRRSAPATARRSTSASVRRPRAPSRRAPTTCSRIHRGGRQLRRRRRRRGPAAPRHERDRQPAYPVVRADGSRGPGRRSLAARPQHRVARRALLGLTVGVDALCLGPNRWAPS